MALAAVYPRGVAVTWEDSTIPHKNTDSWGKASEKGSLKAQWFTEMIIPILQANGNPDGTPKDASSIVKVDIRGDKHNRTIFSEQKRDAGGNLELPIRTLSKDRFWVGMHITVDFYTQDQMNNPFGGETDYWSCHLYVDNGDNNGKRLAPRGQQRRGGGPPLPNVEFWAEVRADGNNGPDFPSTRPTPLLPANLGATGTPVIANNGGLHNAHQAELNIASFAYFRATDALWIGGETGAGPRPIAPAGFRPYTERMPEVDAIARANLGAP